VPATLRRFSLPLWTWLVLSTFPLHGGEDRDGLVSIGGEIENLDCVGKKRGSYLYMEEKIGTKLFCSLLPILSASLPCCKKYTKSLN
jgi:hypothetical protein